MTFIVVSGNTRLSEEGCGLLEQEGARLTHLPMMEAEELAAASRQADALITFLTPVSAPVIAGMERCRIIARLGVGYDLIDLEAARARGIPVTNVPDYCTAEVADHALVLTLSLLRQLPFLDGCVRSDTWFPSLPRRVPACEEQTFGVLGFGRIGRAAIHRARVFGFRLAACDPYVPETDFAAAGVTRLTFEELLAQSDILSLHTPLTPETDHLMNAAALARMKSSALLINTARGAIVDNRALAEALRAGRLAAAGIDVFEEEPLPADHPLRACSNAQLTPHFAWHSTLSEQKLHLYGTQEVLRALRGEPLHYCVNGV